MNLFKKLTQFKIEYIKTSVKINWLLWPRTKLENKFQKTLEVSLNSQNLFSEKFQKEKTFLKLNNKLNTDTTITNTKSITITKNLKVKKPHQKLKLKFQNNKHWLKTKLMPPANNLLQFQLRTHKDLLLLLDQHMEVIQLTL